MNTDQAPPPVGPYSQAIRAGEILFVSGQLGVDMDTGALAKGGTEAQVEQVLKNLQAIIENAGCTKSDIAKTTIFLTNFDDFAGVNKIYAEFFKENRPARSTVGVSRLPLGASVEIEAIVVRLTE